jgi:GNAT superfamily N-acetyltransferase
VIYARFIRYIRSGWGWDNDKKKREMLEQGTRYVLIHQNDSSSTTGKPVAFLSFQLVQEDINVQEDEKPQMINCAYCYEVHVEPEERGKGLGRLLMLCLEQLALACHLDCCMLTVLTESIIIFII